MKSETIILVCILAVYISQTDGGVICFSGDGFGGCNTGCASKPGFRNGICRPGYLGLYYCVCTSESDGALVPICTGDGGYEACQTGCKIAGGFEAVCETQINYCNCLPKSKNGTITH